MSPKELSAAQAAADAARIDPDQLADLLARHRNADQQASEQLTAGFVYLIWRQFARLKTTKAIARDEVIGVLFIDLATAIKRLAKNAIEPAGIEKYVAQQLNYSLRNYLSEISEDISPPKSTESDRLKRGDSSGRLKRVREIPDERERWLPDEQPKTDLTEDPNIEHPKNYRIPSKYPKQMKSNILAPPPAELLAEKLDGLQAVAKTPFEKSILAMLAMGHSLQDVVSSYRGVSFKQLERILARLLKREAQDN